MEASLSHELPGRTLSAEEKDVLAESNRCIKDDSSRQGYQFVSSRLTSFENLPVKSNLLFIVSFHENSEYDYVILNGPWFIGGHFLIVCKWEPNFRASIASNSSVATWLRLPKLPIEYFDIDILREIGRGTRPLLRVDSHTIAGERGRYNCLCVQLNLHKPLPRFVTLKDKTSYFLWCEFSLFLFVGRSIT
ncbi:hypothetical protein J1N35_024332 [Gossypium stocksii]|uniref:DUF4283 domain-containing protein n=1 Tax=Gossypium stocksii TaxID=47602 RepID=A0A9D3ZWR0_9ROSI|nr:hypothetical protein J1N35_024332 [Gossypium stocksii]